MYILLNGELCTSPLHDLPDAFRSALDRLNAFGDGVFETMLVCNKKVHLLERHMARLDRGLCALDLAESCDQIRKEIHFLVDRLSSEHSFFRLKIIVSRGANLAGYSTAGAKIQRLHIAQPTDLVVSQPVRAFVCQARLGSQPMLAGLKHCNRLEQVLAKTEQERSNYDEGLLLDQSGHVIEAISSNLFILEGNVLITPRLIDCGVAGVMREYICENLAPSLDLTVKQEAITLERLSTSDSVFLTNAIKGVTLLAEFTDQNKKTVTWPAHPTTLRIQQLVLQSMQCQ